MITANIFALVKQSAIFHCENDEKKEKTKKNKTRILVFYAFSCRKRYIENLRTRSLISIEPPLNLEIRISIVMTPSRNRVNILRNLSTVLSSGFKRYRCENATYLSSPFGIYDARISQCQRRELCFSAKNKTRCLCFLHPNMKRSLKFSAKLKREQILIKFVYAAMLRNNQAQRKMKTRQR